jgi:hypothetical protein
VAQHGLQLHMKELSSLILRTQEKGTVEKKNDEGMSYAISTTRSISLGARAITGKKELAPCFCNTILIIYHKNNGKDKEKVRVL